MPVSYRDFSFDFTPRIKKKMVEAKPIPPLEIVPSLASRANLICDIVTDVIVITSAECSPNLLFFSKPCVGDPSLDDMENYLGSTGYMTENEPVGGAVKHVYEYHHLHIPIVSRENDKVFVYMDLGSAVPSRVIIKIGVQSA